MSAGGRPALCLAGFDSGSRVTPTPGRDERERVGLTGERERDKFDSGSRVTPTPRSTCSRSTPLRRNYRHGRAGSTAGRESRPGPPIRTRDTDNGTRTQARERRARESGFDQGKRKMQMRERARAFDSGSRVKPAPTGNRQAPQRGLLGNSFTEKKGHRSGSPAHKACCRQQPVTAAEAGGRRNAAGCPRFGGPAPGSPHTLSICSRPGVRPSTHAKYLGGGAAGLAPAKGRCPPRKTAHRDGLGTAAEWREGGGGSRGTRSPIEMKETGLG